MKFHYHLNETYVNFISFQFVLGPPLCVSWTNEQNPLFDFFFQKKKKKNGKSK